jgi:hypothetical protein
VSLVAVILLILSTNSPASSSLCQLIGVTSDFPHQALSNQPIQVNTTVAGSCASDGEDYFSVRVDLLDKLTNSTISSNSVPVGYNAKNFSVMIANSAVTPQSNVTWPLEIDVYVIESGGVMGKYILSIDNATIQVGTMPMPEIQVTPGSVIPVMLLAAVLVIRLKSSNRRSKSEVRIQ